MTVVEKFATGKRSGIGIQALPQLQLPATAFPDGTLPISLLSAPIEISIQNAVPEFPQDSVIQLYRIEADGTPTPIGPTRLILPAESTDPSFVFEMSIPVADFPAAGTTEQWRLEYSVFEELSGGGPVSGLPVTVIFDQEAPGGVDADGMPILEFTADQLSGITLADIVGDHIEVLLPAWYGEARLDNVKLWLGTSDDLADGSYLANEYLISAPGEGITVNFNLSDMAALGNTRQYFAYQLTDKAGNISPRSHAVAIDVLLSDAPEDLKAPIVPDYLDHGVVTQKDAAELVEVEIPQFTNPAVGDRIYVIWGATRMPPYSIAPSDPWDDPLIEPLATILLPYSDVVSEGSGTGKEVKYEVWRGNLFADTSPPTTVDVNLSTPGPDPDPDPETPWHENLLPPTITSSSGVVDAIPPADYGLNATVTIPHLGVDGQQIWRPNDRVTVFWGGVQVGTPIPVTPANQATDLTPTLPGTAMTSVGLIPVTYTVDRDIPPPPNIGEALSPTKEILVESTGLLPGDGNPLALPVFPEENVALNVINRTTGGLDGTPLRIPLTGVTNVAIGDLLNVRFVGRNSLTDPLANELVGTLVVVTDHRITDQELNTDGYYEYNLPYNNILRSICRNGSTTDYSITNGSGTTNGTQKFVRVVLDQPGSVGVCPINP
ncbi:MAG: hypothetical protein JWQ69_4162 [Pseudomonas sp.]|nr:hypothetical protein [Pseudomonas sp.]